MPLLGMVDTGVLGHLDSAEYLAGVALGGALFSLLFMGMNFLRMGTTGIASQAFGRQDGAALRECLWQAVIVATLIAAVLISLQRWIGLLAWAAFDAGEAAERAAGVYFHIRIWSAPATLINYVLIGWFIGLQKTRVPLLMVVTTNVVNIVLDFVFVVGLDMDADGVALATLIGEGFGLLVGGWFVRRELLRWPSVISRERLLRPRAYGRFFAVNGNILVRTLALVGTLTFMTAQGARFGEAVLAANAILMNFQYLLSYGLDGLAHAAEALVGRAWGARDKRALQRAVALTLGWSCAVAVLFMLAFMLVGEQLVALLTDLPEVRRLAMIYLPWIVLSTLISVFSFVYDGVFVGTTWTRDMRNIMLISAFAVFLPTWWLSYGLDNHGLWLSFVVFMAARGIGMLVVFRRNLSDAATERWFSHADRQATR